MSPPGGLAILDPVDVQRARLEQVRTELCRRSFARFVREAWPQIDPAPLVWGWHLQALCDHLQAVTEGRIRRLCINVPPGHAKSMIVSVLWPAWSWARRPSWRLLCTSYGADLALRDAVKSRTLIESDWYKARFTTYDVTDPDTGETKRETWALTSDRNQKSEYANTALGERKAAGLTGGLTGFRGDAVVIDDPLSAANAHSKVAKAEVLRIWREVLPSRLNDQRTGAFVIIMQRLADDDLAGYVLETDPEFVHLSLPTEYEPPGKRACKCASCTTGATAIGWRDPRTKPGELLFPARFPASVVADKKRTLGTNAFAAQEQQRPVPEGGGMLKRAWWCRVWRAPGEPDQPVGGAFEVFEVKTIDPRGKFDELLLAVDCSFKESDGTDFVAMGVWGRRGPDMFLIDLFWDRAGFVATCEALEQLCKKWPKVRAKIIEDKANGPAVIDTLRRKIPGLIPVQPEGGKESRIAAASPYIEAGNVWLPMHAPWRERFVTEAVAFPFGAHDDAIDMAAYAINRMAAKGAAYARLRRAVHGAGASAR